MVGFTLTLSTLVHHVEKGLSWSQKPWLQNQLTLSNTVLWMMRLLSKCAGLKYLQASHPGLDVFGILS